MIAPVPIPVGDDTDVPIILDTIKVFVDGVYVKPTLLLAATFPVTLSTNIGYIVAAPLVEVTFTLLTVPDATAYAATPIDALGKNVPSGNTIPV